jgi:hypothetical protein
MSIRQRSWVWSIAWSIATCRAACPIPDKRRTLLAITSDGLKLTETLEQAGHDVTTETLAPLTPEEQATLYDLLAKVI